MPATMADVAHLAGVSKKSVSNYVNGYPYMTESTRARIRAAIEQLDYRVNISARNLSSGRTGTIALVMPEIAQPYFAEFAQSVVTAAQRRGLGVVVEITRADRDEELAALTRRSGRSVDGLIFHPLALAADEVEQASVDVPVVLIGDRVSSSRFDLVTMANEQGAYEITRLLLAEGRRRVVALGMEHPNAQTAAAQRFAGYQRAHEEAGVALAADLFAGPIPWTRGAGAEAVAALLDDGVALDAVFGFNDALALGALGELLRRGHAVPGDTAVAGFDDIAEAALAYPPLTTLASGRDWIAEQAVARLVERLEHPELAPETLVAKHRVVRRASA